LARPDLWKEDLIAARFASGHLWKGFLLKMENKAKGYFSSTPNNKEGSKFLDCNDNDLQDILKFLVTLTNPAKPIRMSVWMVSTILDCLLNPGQRYQGRILKLSRDKILAFFLLSYVVHLYHKQRTLMKEEKSDYGNQAFVVEIGGDPDQEQGLKEEPVEEEKLTKDPSLDIERTPCPSKERPGTNKTKKGQGVGKDHGATWEMEQIGLWLNRARNMVR
jgi:hypothetical protein